MQRFLVIAWDENDIQETKRIDQMLSAFLASMPEWTCSLRAPGLVAIHAVAQKGGLCAYVLPSSRGVIFGALFTGSASRGYQPAEESTIAAHSTAIVNTGGQQLLRDYWGCYVAFLNDSARRKTLVLRDPSGKVPCFRAPLNRATLFFSEVSDLVRFAPSIRLSVNWQRIAIYLQLNEHRIVGSCLREVDEVLAGGRVEIGDGAATDSFVWDPRTYWRSSEIVDNYDDAVRCMRTVTQHCIDAWATIQPNVLLNLSGGFDSAVVLGCAARSRYRPRVTCLNRYAHGPAEDERDYARAAARRASVELIESEWTAGGLKFDAGLLDPPLTARPTGALLFLRDSDFRNRIASDAGADVIWTGEGGDHFFVRHTGTPSAADYVYHHGVRPALNKAIQDNARCSGDSYWTVLGAALKLGYSRSPWTPADAELETIPFVSEAALPVDAATQTTHPWNRDADDLPKGKQLQIRGYAEILNRAASIPRHKIVEENHPLISQPLMELCLRIPTYLLLAGGSHRGLARVAFADCLPEKIRSRESKGCTASTVVRLFQENISFVRELLFEGHLAHEKIIDVGALDSVVTSGRPLRPEHIFPLLGCLSAELWVRACPAPSLRQAA